MVVEFGNKSAIDRVIKIIPYLNSPTGKYYVECYLNGRYSTKGNKEEVLDKLAIWKDEFENGEETKHPVYGSVAYWKLKENWDKFKDYEDKELEDRQQYQNTIDDIQGYVTHSKVITDTDRKLLKRMGIKESVVLKEYKDQKELKKYIDSLRKANYKFGDEDFEDVDVLNNNQAEDEKAKFSGTGKYRVYGPVKNYDILSKLNTKKGAGFITPNDNIYIGFWHEYLRERIFGLKYYGSHIPAGCVRIRFSGSQGCNENYTVIQFTSKDANTLERVINALKNVGSNTGRYNVEYDVSRGAGYIEWYGTREEVLQQIVLWSNHKSSPKTGSPGYWHLKEYKDQKELKKYMTSLRRANPEKFKNFRHNADTEQVVKDKETEDYSVKGPFKDYSVLSNLNYDMGAGFITEEGKIYISSYHSRIRRHVYVKDKTAPYAYYAGPEIPIGAVRIRYSGTAGVSDNTLIEFSSLDQSTLEKVINVLHNVNSSSDHFDIIYNPPTKATKRFNYYTREEAEILLSKYIDNKSPSPKLGSPGYWHLKENKLSYKEFSNSSKAKDKNCANCNQKFKNVHSKDQQYCSMKCENTGKLTEAFNAVRQKAGIIPYFIDNKGIIRMLFARSSDPTYGGPSFMISKGGVDKGETPLQAALREGNEENGLKMSNIKKETLSIGWKGDIKGMTETSPMTIYICEVIDPVDFDKFGYETAETKWMTMEEYNKIGRKSQAFIVNACYGKIDK